MFKNSLALQIKILQPDFSWCVICVGQHIYTSAGLDQVWDKFGYQILRLSYYLYIMYLIKYLFYPTLFALLRLRLI